MKQFLKFTLASLSGIILGGLLLVIILGTIASGGSDAEIKLEDAHILKISLNGPIQDRVAENPFDIYGQLLNNDPSVLGLNDVLESINKAKDDEYIKAIYLDMGYVGAGYATMEEIRNALLDFKSSGKTIIAYSEVFTQSSYYLASVANKVIMYPEGGMELKGMNSQITFYTDALKKIGIEPQVIRHGKFKSAVEPFMLTSMSDENRNQIKTYMGSIWDHYLANISQDRNIDIDRLNAIVEGFEIKNSNDAVHLGLIDTLYYKDELQNEFAQLMGTDSIEDVNFIEISKYSRVNNGSARQKYKKDKVAVIYAQGEIQSGQGSETVIGSERISKAIRTARLDDKVKAVVLRVNSPGGSALASDVIWREAKLCKDVKPFVVSMGDVAASGGYYIAAAADKIYASPNTITGSIGVFGMLLNLEKLYTEKLGLTFDQVKTNQYADIGSMTRALTADEYDIIQSSVVDVYETFTSKVSEGRNISQQEVDAIGQGRVWSGENALDINLIDAYGGLYKAIDGAAELANLEDYRITELPVQKDPFVVLMESIEENAKAYLLKSQLGDQYHYYKTINDIQHLKGIQARMPYQVTIN